jgi:hypothetical protein
MSERVANRLDPLEHRLDGPPDKAHLDLVGVLDHRRW